MRVDLDETLHLRLPRDLRRDLDGAAQAADDSLSSIARRALTVGLKAIRFGVSNDDDRPPPGATGGVPSLPAAAA